MFDHVLIAEDHQHSKLSIEQTLRELQIPDCHYAYYCDDALLYLKNSILDRMPVELLITDLSFDEDDRLQTIHTGMGLIEAAKKMRPELKTLVFSIESNPDVVRDLFQRFQVDGFVRKSRRDADELKTAIRDIAMHKKYIPHEFIQAVRDKNAFDFSALDIMIVSQLATGTLQKNIPSYLEKQGVKASSLRSVEKRLNAMKDALGCHTNEHLIAYCKDRRII